MKTLRIKANQAGVVGLIKKLDLTPSDYNCDSVEQLADEALRHVDGVAVALEIDDDYKIEYVNG